MLPRAVGEVRLKNLKSGSSILPNMVVEKPFKIDVSVETKSLARVLGRFSTKKYVAGQPFKWSVRLKNLNPKARPFYQGGPVTVYVSIEYPNRQVVFHQVQLGHAELAPGEEKIINLGTTEALTPGYALFTVGLSPDVAEQTDVFSNGRRMPHSWSVGPSNNVVKSSPAIHAIRICTLEEIHTMWSLLVAIGTMIWIGVVETLLLLTYLSRPG